MRDDDNKIRVVPKANILESILSKFKFLKQLDWSIAKERWMIRKNNSKEGFLYANSWPTDRPIYKKKKIRVAVVPHFSESRTSLNPPHWQHIFFFVECVLSPSPVVV